MLIVCMFQFGRVYYRIIGSKEGECRGEKKGKAKGSTQGGPDGGLLELSTPLSNAHVTAGEILTA